MSSDRAPERQLHLHCTWTRGVEARDARPTRPPADHHRPPNSHSAWTMRDTRSPGEPPPRLSHHQLADDHTKPSLLAGHGVAKDGRYCTTAPQTPSPPLRRSKRPTDNGGCPLMAFRRTTQPTNQPTSITQRLREVTALEAAARGQRFELVAQVRTEQGWCWQQIGAELAISCDRLDELARIGIDDISYKKGHEYLMGPEPGRCPSRAGTARPRRLQQPVRSQSRRTRSRCRRRSQQSGCYSWRSRRS